ncbi:MAG: leucine--tRNA ligase [Endomicrobiales bacterium]|nr:leucine--tRNA ligase [Endomicrobiales bacterium]
MANYDFSVIENKWQKFWEDKGTFCVKNRDKRPKYYCLVMFPYPSGKLHMGHVRNYVLGDVFARFYSLKGYQVIQPIGWDSFGLPAENAAIKNNVNPGAWTKQNIAQMTTQLKALGIAYDWDREIATCTPEYYGWNQWFFIKMWERGLAYKKSAKVNWCPSCATVLANEQVTQGQCWRCSSTVLDRQLEQWFLKITDYADELLSGHDELKNGWPEEVLLMQKNWIGKSFGAELNFNIVADNGENKTKLTVFTTRPDTLFGVTFMALAPEHELLTTFQSPIKNISEVNAYIAKAKQQAVTNRTISGKEKTGVKLEGLYAINPVNGSKIPLFVTDYVLMDYGTGAIMAVPAHDQRDWEFAKKYSMPIIEVIKVDGANLNAGASEGEGVMVNSGEFNSIPSEDAKEKIAKWVEAKGFGKKTIKYRIKDWLISRQRYWGTPIPMLNCPSCGIVAVPLSDLPVKLPDNIKLTGEGQSPLASCSEFVNAKCPKCGGFAKRETDTMDTFVDSSWYYARYCDAKNTKMPFAKEFANQWLPVDQYIGGIEHACMHLIYSRFWHKVMRDLGLVNCNEPFAKLLTQGMVTLGGSAMSKSRGNIVTQDEIIAKYGTDTARLFIMFAAPPKSQLEWSSDGVEGAWRFLNRVWRLFDKFNQPYTAGTADKNDIKELLRITHYTIKKTTDDISAEQQLNTAISSIMELVNALYAYKFIGDETSKNAYEVVVLLLSPFAPHMCEELWQMLGYGGTLSNASWPVANKEYLVCDTLEIPVQINGKLRGKVKVASSATEEVVKSTVLSSLNLKQYLNGKTVVKFIYVKSKIVNLILK